MKHLRILISQKAFTVVELLVVIFLLVMLTSMAIFYSSSAEDQVNVFREEGRVLTALYTARDLAIETYGKGGTSDVPCAYGIQVVPTQTNGTNIAVFAYKPDVSGQCENIFTNTNGPDPANMTTVSQVALEGGYVSSNFSSLFFVPPDPRVCVSHNVGTYSCNQNAFASFLPCLFVRGARGSSDSIPISINQFGQITTNDVSCQQN